ncbi:hypothetical protein PSPO_a2745 [Pseudoalteromonas spongiae UST010723-006]|nr:hypothetical protein PSPO_a2745 [Pseudoalteromonas spongiae UST010723-006]
MWSYFTFDAADSNSKRQALLVVKKTNYHALIYSIKDNGITLQ